MKKILHDLNLSLEILIYKKFQTFKPDKNFGKFWTIFSLIFFIFIILIAPLDIGFNILIKNEENFFDLLTKAFIYKIAIIIFVLDMLINMNTAFYSKGVLVLEKSLIVKNYFKKYFFQDLSSLLNLIFCYKIIFIIKVSLISLTISLKEAKIVLLIKIFRIRSRIRKLEEYFEISGNFQSFVDLIKLLFIMLYTSHLSCCIYHYIGCTR